MKFEGIDDREGADGLRGTSLFIRSDELEELESGWWEHEVVGMEVVDANGRVVGSVQSVVQGEHQDLWVVATGESSFMLPAVEGIVQHVDKAAKRVVVDLPEGLIEG